MNLSINGQSQVPPGFRFHPTEEELLHYYLRKKVAYKKIDLDVIRDVDLNKLEPWDIQEKCRIGSTPQNDWYFFSHKDKKYPTGTRTNRATAAGFWKATGRDKIIYTGFKRIGLRKTLVFYKGRAPHGQKSDWIMHEYRLDESNQEPPNGLATTDGGEMISEDGWVVCRVFKKKNYQKTLDSPQSASVGSKLQMLCAASGNDAGVLDQILSYMGQRKSNCKIENDTTVNNILDDNLSETNNNNNNNTMMPNCFVHLPRLESPTMPNSVYSYNHYQPFDEVAVATVSLDHLAPNGSTTDTVNDWVALDRLVASQLNGQAETEPSRQFGCFGLALDDNDNGDNEEVQFSQIRFGSRGNNQSLNNMFSSSESDLWSNFTTAKSTSSASSDPLRHLSV